MSDDDEMKRTGYTKKELRDLIYPFVELTGEMRTIKVDPPDRLRIELLKVQDERMKENPSKEAWLKKHWLLSPNRYPVRYEMWQEWAEIMRKNPDTYRESLNLSDWNLYLLETFASNDEFHKCSLLSVLCGALYPLGPVTKIFTDLQDLGLDPVIYIISGMGDEEFFFSLKGLPPPIHAKEKLDFNREAHDRLRKRTLKKPESS